MVIFDPSNNGGGKAKGTLHMQGMDILFLMTKYKPDRMANIMASDFFECFQQVYAEIKSTKTGSEEHDTLLRNMHKFGIEFTKKDDEFKKFITGLVRGKVLYSKERLSKMSKEVIAAKLEIIDSKNKYEMNSLKFAKYVIAQMEEYNDLCRKLQEQGGQNYKAFYEMDKIKEGLLSMGLGINN